MKSSVKMMRVTRKSLNEVGRLIYDHFRKTECRRVSLENAIEAQDVFKNIDQAMAWIKNR